MLKLWLHPDILFHLSANGKEQLNTSADFRQYVKKVERKLNRFNFIFKIY